MRGCRTFFPVVLLAACAAAGCVPPPGEPPPAGPEPTTPATEEECRTVAVELEQAVRSKDPSQAIQAFALEVVAHRVVTGLPVAEGLKTELLKLLPARADTNAVIDRVVTGVAQGGQFKLLRVGPADGGGYKATFRITSATLSLTYVDVFVAKFPGGRAGVEDVVWVEDGDRMTELVRQKILPAAALRDPGLDARLSEEDRLYLANAKKVDDLHQAFRKRQWPELIKLYQELPAGLQDRKPILFKYASACARTGGADAKAALERCRQKFPGDPAADMVAMDYHLKRREFGAVRRILDALRAWAGEDAALDALKALLLGETGQMKAARTLAEQAVATDPGLKIPYVVRITLALVAQDHADTLTWLKKMVQNTGQDFGDLRRNPPFERFVQSPEFRQWLAWRATRQGG
jgi:hypothetical protein